MPPETILVVDDELSLRGLVVEILRRSGYRVIEAESGCGALVRVGGHEGAIHVALVALTLPDMGGFEFMSILARTHPETHPVFMSGSTELAETPTLPSKTIFLGKPFGMAELVQCVEDATRGRLSPGGEPS